MYELNQVAFAKMVEYRKSGVMGTNRRKIKPMNPLAKERMQNKLTKYPKHVQNLMIHRSITNYWSDVWPSNNTLDHDGPDQPEPRKKQSPYQSIKEIDANIESGMLDIIDKVNKTLIA